MLTRKKINELIDLYKKSQSYKSGNKPFTIVYEKEFVDTVVYIEEIRTGRKKLALKTMYKRKTKARK